MARDYLPDAAYAADAADAYARASKFATWLETLEPDVFTKARNSVNSGSKDVSVECAGYAKDSICAMFRYKAKTFSKLFPQFIDQYRFRGPSVETKPTRPIKSL